MFKNKILRRIYKSSSECGCRVNQCNSKLWVAACAPLTIARTKSSLSLPILFAFGSPRVLANCIQDVHQLVTTQCILRHDGPRHVCSVITITAKFLMPRPLVMRATTKSMGHTWMAAVGRSNACRSASGIFLRLRLFTYKQAWA